MTKLTKFILAILLQIGIISAIIIFKLSVLTGGTEILLQVEPVDPRSPLRGDYATFQYDISRVSSYYVQGGQVRNGDTVYVTLFKSGKYWQTKYVSLNKPSGTDEIFIKGTVTSGGKENDLTPLPRTYSNTNLTVDYGIEDYFIPEGTGQNFSFFNKDVAASVAVDENGNAVLKQLYVEGKPWP